MQSDEKKYDVTNKIYVYAAGIVVAAVTMAFYAETLTFAFVNWDDGGYIAGNPVLRLNGIEFLKKAFASFVMGNWHPLTVISYKIDKMLWGLDPFGYHLTNSLLHSANTFLVFLLTFKVCSLKEKNMFEGGVLRKAVAAAVAALLFGLHPIHVESVAWISERKDVLSTLFFLAGLLYYAEYAGSDESNKKKNYLMTFSCFILSILSKPMAVTFPVVLIIADIYPLRRVKELKGLIAVFKEKALFFAVAFAAGMATLFAQKPAMGLGESLSLHVRLVKAIHSYGFYLYKTVYPESLAAIYSYPKVMGLLSPQFLGAAAVFVVLCVFSVFWARKRPYVAAVWVFYIVTLLPVIGLVQVGGQSAADRYMYIPSIAIFMLLGAGVSAFLFANQWIPVRVAAVATLSIIVAVMALKTSSQIKVWKDSYSLWTNQIEQPGELGGIGYFWRGNYLFGEERFEEAIADLTIAIRMDPYKWENRNSRGIAYAKLGKRAPAEEDFKAAIALAPDQSDALANLSFFYKENGKREHKEYFSLAEKVFAGGTLSDKELKRIGSTTLFRK